MSEPVPPAAPISPAAPVPLAAAVILLRPAAQHFEVFMVRRSSRLAFMPEALVFPGGRVDAADADPALDALLGIDPAAAARALGLAEDAAGCATARSVWAAAARECLEESGVLLGIGPAQLAAAGPAATQLLAETRVALNADALHLTEALVNLAAHGLRPDLAGLAFVDHWITPPVERRRYDTRFFAAAVAPGQDACFAEGEHTAGAWYTPSAALAAGEAGVLSLAPPTLRQLYDLAAAPDLAAVRARGTRRPRPLMPQARLDPDGSLALLLPGDAEFDPPGPGRNRVTVVGGRCVSEGHPIRR